MGNSKRPSRAEIEAALERAVCATLANLDMVEDSVTLTRTFRALVGIGLDMLVAGGAPVGVIAGQLDRVLRKKLSGRPAKRPNTVLLMKPAKA